MPGFKVAKAKIHLLSDDLERLYKKEKYKNLFDIGVFSIHSGNVISEDMSVLFKKGSRIHIESSDNLVILKKEQRDEYKTKMNEKCEKAGLKKIDKTPYKHHMLYEI